MAPPMSASSFLDALKDEGLTVVRSATGVPTTEMTKVPGARSTA